MKNRLGIEINIEAEMYVLSKQFIVLSPSKLQASAIVQGFIPTPYTPTVFSINIIHRKKRKGEKKRRMVVTKSGKTGRESAVFLVTTWRKIEKTLLYLNT